MIMRLIALAAALSLTPHAYAQQCYYYWASDCFEIRDAASRDIVHHVLVSPEPREFEADSEQCDATINQLLDIDKQAAALKRLNKVLGRIDGCKRLDQLQPKVFSSGTEAFDSYQRMAAERAFKVVHTSNPLPGP